MVKTRKYFWFIETLLVAGFIFFFGILTGVFIENARVGQVDKNFAQLESDILDARILSDVISSSDCSLAIKENMDFADRVFFEARLLEKYETSSEITDSIRIQHKKYDLLRAMVWLNSISIKNKCNASYHTAVYLYNYNNPTLSERAKQTVISNVLSDLKQEKGEGMLLISMAGDIGSPSIELLKKKYGISQLPVILIDEKYTITNIENRAEIDALLT